MLIHEEGIVQKSIYYISRLIKDAETRYTKIGKIILALVILA